jgi:hypothetical protein
MRRCSKPVEMIIKVLCDIMELLWLGSDPKFEIRPDQIARTCDSQNRDTGIRGSFETHSSDHTPNSTRSALSRDSNRKEKLTKQSFKITRTQYFKAQPQPKYR